VDSPLIVDGADLDLSGLQILPGLINAHDHLSFALFPLLGSPPYPNATEWARDIYHPERDPVRRHHQVPKRLRLIWGGLRNLLSGVTTVCHHDPLHPIFDRGFPVRVIKEFGWAHSFEFTKDVGECFAATPSDAPFVIHLAEGTDAQSGEEIFRLDRMGALTPRTVLVHAVGLTSEGWRLVRESGASVVWCPRSNLYSLGRTLSKEVVESGIPIALATDSPITAPGDLLDDIRHVRENFCFSDAVLRRLTIEAPAKILRLTTSPNDWIAVRAFGEPPELVVIGGLIRLIDGRLANRLPLSVRDEFEGVEICGSSPVLLRWWMKQLIEETQAALQSDQIFLAGRAVGLVE